MRAVVPCAADRKGLRGRPDTSLSAHVPVPLWDALPAPPWSTSFRGLAGVFRGGHSVGGQCGDGRFRGLTGTGNSDFAKAQRLLSKAVVESNRPGRITNHIASLPRSEKDRFERPRMRQRHAIQCNDLAYQTIQADTVHPVDRGIYETQSQTVALSHILAGSIGNKRRDRIADTALGREMSRVEPFVVLSGLIQQDIEELNNDVMVDSLAAFCSSTMKAPKRPRLT